MTDGDGAPVSVGDRIRIVRGWLAGDDVLEVAQVKWDAMREEWMVTSSRPGRWCVECASNCEVVGDGDW